MYVFTRWVRYTCLMNGVGHVLYMPYEQIQGLWGLVNYLIENSFKVMKMSYAAARNIGRMRVEYKTNAYGKGMQVITRAGWNSDDE